jgi:hypothetical protein
MMRQFKHVGQRPASLSTVSGFEFEKCGTSGLDIRIGVDGGDERRFELRRREIDASLEQMVEEPAEFLRV